MMFRLAPTYSSIFSKASDAAFTPTFIDEAITLDELFLQRKVGKTANYGFTANFCINHRLPFQHAFSLLVID